jgi:hypothetical protein
MNSSRTVPLFKIWFAIASCLMIILLFLDACTNVSPSVSGAPSHGPFKDYNEAYKPPVEQYSGTLFKLSQDYPTQMPDRKVPSFTIDQRIGGVT